MKNLVCEGCGEQLEQINNDLKCNHCNSFRKGTQEKYFKIARVLVKKNMLRVCNFLNENDYNNSSDMWNQFLEIQTAPLSPIIAYIDYLLKKETNYNDFRTS